LSGEAASGFRAWRLGAQALAQRGSAVASRGGMALRRKISETFGIEGRSNG